MLKRADIKNFLLALPLAVLFCLTILPHEGKAQALWLQNKILQSSSDTPSPQEIRENKIQEFYKNNNLEATKLDDTVLSLLDESQFSYLGGGKNKIKRIKNNIEKLAQYTGVEGVDKFTNAANIHGIYSVTGIEYIKDSLAELLRDDLISKETHDVVWNYAYSLYSQGLKNATDAAKYADDQELSLQISTYANRMTDVINQCPTVEIIRAKYQSGCWSCLVVEKLTSAFMTAASKAYSLSQKAGLVLLECIFSYPVGTRKYLKRTH